MKRAGNLNLYTLTVSLCALPVIINKTHPHNMLNINGKQAITRINLSRSSLHMDTPANTLRIQNSIYLYVDTNAIMPQQ